MYEEPKPTQRRKRGADGDLLARISQLESLLKQHGIDPDSEGGTVRQMFFRTSNGDAVDPKHVKPESAVELHDIMAATSEPDGALKLPLDNPTWLKFMEKSTPNDPHVSISASLTPPAPNFLQLHPEPRHIFRLWQVFVERSHPVIKVLHAPSTQQRILDVSWNLQSCTNSFHALLFSVYLLAVVSLSTEECHQHFGEEKGQLLKRYRTAAWQALLAADLFHSREMEVLQAFILFALSDSRSDTSTTLSALAVRIAMKMGLGTDKGSEELSFFEQEMRIRLWWQITTQDVLARHYFVGRDGRNADGLIIPTIRLPLNVDDAELHPDMTKFPVEHSRATEMMYVLIRYEGGAFGQKQRTKMRMASDMKSPFNEMQKLFEEKYLRHCDPSIPLHRAAKSMFRFAMTGINYRLGCHEVTGGNVSEEELLDMAIDVLDADQESRDNQYADQLLWKISPVDLDAVVHILTKLRHNGAGERVERAWSVIVKFWDEHVGGDWGDEAVSQNSFFARLADLTLEGWGVRRRELAHAQGPAIADEMTPACLKQLQQLRPATIKVDEHEGDTEATVLPTGDFDSNTGPSQNAFDFLTADDIPADLFGYGNDLLYDFGFWSDYPPAQ